MGRLRKRIERKRDPGINRVISGLLAVSSSAQAPIWKDVAHRLASPRRNWPSVNLSKIDLFAQDGDEIVVPGKLLGAGTISKKVTVAAYSASSSAKQKLAAAGASFMSIEELAERNPKGSRIRIIG